MKLLGGKTEHRMSPSIVLRKTGEGDPAVYKGKGSKAVPILIFKADRIIFDPKFDPSGSYIVQLRKFLPPFMKVGMAVWTSPPSVDWRIAARESDGRYTADPNWRDQKSFRASIEIALPSLTITDTSPISLVFGG
jgi:hypothetical protein